MSRIQVYDSLVATYQWMTMAMEAMKAKPMSRTCVDVQSDTAMDESDFSVGHVLKGLAGAMNPRRGEGFCWGQLAKDYAGKASDVFVVPSCVCAKKAFDISHVCLKRKM